jgi:hypothetical protein
MTPSAEGVRTMVACLATGLDVARDFTLGERDCMTLHLTRP